jgi:prephenate dehydrogenase
VGNLPRRAAVIGTGLIGGSIALGLRRRGWVVSGTDRDVRRAERALALGAIDRIGTDPDALVTFVAVPAGAVAEVATAALAGLAHGLEAGAPAPVVTDVAGIKHAIVSGIDHPNFVGGHPMAGSEQEGVEGSDPDLFVGATWVLTPSETTDPAAYATAQSVVSLLGANPVAVPARRHDDLVALVSHTPHLTAAALMNLAVETSADDATLLRLAAGGFRDMTRVAAGHPGIWPDVVAHNRDAILATIDRLSEALGHLRATVAAGDRAGLLAFLERAREARINLPVGAPSIGDALEVRVPVPDRPGVISEVTTSLGELGVNIFDFEIAHSAEGERGVVVLVVDATDADAVRKALSSRGYRPSFRPLGAWAHE